jgi:hypothetical protein
MSTHTHTHTHPYGFQSLGAFYSVDRVRARSREQDLGLWWRAGQFGGPTYRAAWIEDTGEVYVMQHEGLRGGGHVEVIGFAESWEEVVSRVPAWELMCGELGSIHWLTSRFRTPRKELLAA